MVEGQLQPILSLTLHSVYGIAFFAMGLLVAVRVLGYRPSEIRLRLQAVAWFGILHGTAEWLCITRLVEADPVPQIVRQGIEAMSFLPLYWFALGGARPRHRLPLACVAISAVTWIAIVLAWDHPSAPWTASALLAAATTIACAVALAMAPGLHAAERPLRHYELVNAAMVLVFGLLHGVLALATIGGWSIPEGWVVAMRTASGLAFALTCFGMQFAFDRVMAARTKQQAEQANSDLSASEARYRAILDAEPECVKIIDRDGRVAEMNPAGLAMVEAGSIADVQNMDPVDLLVPADRPRFRSAIDAAFHGRQTTLEYELVGLKGTRRWIEQRAAPLFSVDVPGQVSAMLAVSRDITDRVRAERTLRETTLRLQEAQRIARLGSWEFDARTGQVIWSDENYRMFEIDPSRRDLSVGDYLRRVHADDRAMLKDEYTASLVDRRPREVVHRIVLPGRRIRWVLERWEIMTDPDGAVAGARGTVQDITEQRATGDALRQSEATLDGFLQMSPEAVIVTDAARHITLFSSGAERIFGHSAADVIGQPVETLMPDRLRADHQRHVERFAASPDTGRAMGERAEVTGLRADGTEFPAEASICKIESPGGMLFAVTVRDVSHQKAVHDDLVRARIAAESASAAKSRFIANTSHELRTPLNAIIGFAEMMAQPERYTLNEARQQEYAGIILQSGRHLLNVINDILDVSRLDLGNTTLSEEIADIVDIVESCVRMVRQRASEGGIVVLTDIEPGLPRPLADPRLLLQALLNLMSNAIKFTPRGGHVSVGVARSADGGMDLFVRDTGIGMSAEDVTRIGEPFMQVDAGLSRRFDGTGLGLAIVKRLADLHGGNLRVESTPGHGTLATIHLPAHRVVAAAAGRSA